MHARSTVETLDGARLEKADATSWHGFFIGNVGIESVNEDAGAVRFDVVVPTASSDIEDFKSGRASARRARLRRSS